MDFTLDKENNHLDYGKKYLSLMTEIKDNSIPLHLKTHRNIQKDVLKNKSVTLEGCTDITKLLALKDDLNCKNVYLKSITFELECK